MNTHQLLKEQYVLCNSYNNIQLFENLLEDGKAILTMELGIISKIDGNNYEIVAINDVANDFKPGDILRVSNTFCREVISTNKTIMYTEFLKTPGMREHPLYTVNALEAYIGAPIRVNGNMWGTINFSSMKIRSYAFSAEDVAIIESYSALVSASLSTKL